MQKKFINFQKKYNTKNFPLTTLMIEKNNYENANVFYEKDYDGLSAVCIFYEYFDEINISVLEVRNDCRNSNLGTEILNKIKNLNKPIILQSIPKVKNFYRKNGFVNYEDYDDYMIFNHEAINC